MSKVMVTISPEQGRVRLLARTTTQDVLKAVLGPVERAHPKAAATLLEGLSLWYQEPLSVVLVVDERSNSGAMSLCDTLGFGVSTLHYEVAIATLGRAKRHNRHLVGMGDFRDLRQLSLWGVDT
ncbi:MAG: hypothetical protein IPK82_32455 [Polyangiaceae bacterium]|nr:hypothetical protein [Polyangiaceae bacterium]